MDAWGDAHDPESQVCPVCDQEWHTEDCLFGKEVEQRLKAVELQMTPQLEREKAQISLQAKHAEMQQSAQLEREKLAASFDMEAHKAALSPETKNMQTTQQGLGELKQMIEQSNKDQSEMLVEAFRQLLGAISSPREVVRDPKTNRIVGVQPKAVN